MNEHVDEEIGALLDGRLDERRRSELLARLATADEDYEVFADTASVLQEAGGGGFEEAPEPDRREEAPRSAPVIPLRPRRAAGWRSPAVRTLAMAATVAAIALVPVLRSRMNGGGWRDPERLAVLSADEGPLPTALLSERPWPTTRGGPGNSVAELAAAAKVGTLQTDLEVVANAKGARDTAVLRGLADETAGTLQAIGRSGSGWIENRYRLIATSTTWSHPKLLAELDTSRAQVVEFVDPDYFAAGAWAEAARVAASRGNTAFFRTPESLRALKHAGSLGLSEKSKSVIDGLIQQEGEVSDWAALREDLRSLHQELVTTREPLP